MFIPLHESRLCGDALRPRKFNNPRPAERNALCLSYPSCLMSSIRATPLAWTSIEQYIPSLRSACLKL